MLRWQKQGGWEVYEGEDVSPTFCGQNARDDAVSYAQQRAGFAPTEIQLLDNEWNVLETISPAARARPNLIRRIAER